MIILNVVAIIIMMVDNAVIILKMEVKSGGSWRMTGKIVVEDVIASLNW